MERVDRWGDSMQALWGSLGICPPIDHIGLPHCTQKNYILSATSRFGEMSKTASHYGLSFSASWWDFQSWNLWHGHWWISSLQARVSSMVELWRCYLPYLWRSDWPYILIQLYEGTNHMPLPEGQTYLYPSPGEGRKPKWVDKPTKNLPASIHWALVVFPIELNWGDQSVTIDLPKSLHTSSSVTADEYPYIKVNIPMSILEEQDHGSLPLSGKHNTPTITQPKAPWNLGSLSQQRWTI